MELSLERSFTEFDWLTSSDAHAMLEYLYPASGLHSTPVQPRKLRLYYLALVRRHTNRLPAVALSLVRYAEKIADGLSATPAEFAELTSVAETLAESGGSDCVRKWRECELRLAKLGVPIPQRSDLGAKPWDEREQSFESTWPIVLSLQNEVPSPKLLRRAQHDADLLREIYGNPFRYELPANWRNADVVGIARKCYDEDDFRALPVLADALQEAGCPDTHPLVRHCQHEPIHSHVRGCWAIDSILGQ